MAALLFIANFMPWIKYGHFTGPFFQAAKQHLLFFNVKYEALHMLYWLNHVAESSQTVGVGVSALTLKQKTPVWKSCIDMTSSGGRQT